MAVAALVLWVLVVDLLWVFQLTGVAQWWGGAAVLGALTLGAACMSLACRVPSSLRWDGQLWFWGPAGALGQEPFSGRATLAIDLGFFMLLHLQPSSPHARSAWAPLTRRTGQWHRVRCVMAAPPPAGALA